MVNEGGIISTALETDTKVIRPFVYSGAIEIVLAAPAQRRFPTRVSNSLGICLKLGPAHDVRVDGRSMTYAANVLCVRSPGCIWSCDATGYTGFISVDIGRALLPEVEGPPRMRFAKASTLPDLRRLLNTLSSHTSQLAKDEAVDRLVSVACAIAGVVNDTDISPKAVARAREFLDASAKRAPSLEDVATAAGANKHVLVRAFRKRFGVTPHAYLLMLKIEAAREALSRGHAPIDVAGEYGFADQAHFTRAFRRLVGLTPGKYVRTARG